MGCEKRKMMLLCIQKCLYLFPSKVNANSWRILLQKLHCKVRQVPRYANMDRKCLLHRQIIPTGPKILFSPFSHFQVMGRWKSPVAMVKPFNVKANMTLDWREIWNPHGITSFYGLWSIFLYFPTFMTVSSIFWELRNMINVLEEPSNPDKLYYKLP